MRNTSFNSTTSNSTVSNGVKNLLSRYHPYYMRALIYMLQANEYYPFEYLAWYHRTRDFFNIEKRKQLAYTTKAILLSAFAWFSAVFGAVSTALAIWHTGLPAIISAIIGFLIAPFIVPYALFILIFVLNLLQKPVETIIIAGAKRKLKNHPATKIGIAGSFGKTTMREILKTVISQGKRTAAPGGSHNTPLAIARFVRSLSGNEEVLIFEFGEYYPRDIEKLCRFVEPDMGIITGVNEAHLERFGTLERATNTIFELAVYLKDKPVYVNAEGIGEHTKASGPFIFYDRRGTNAWKVAAASTTISGTSVEFSHEGNRVETHSRLLGLHNVGPIAAAAAIASKLGLSDEQIARGIGHTKPFEHRMQPRIDGGVTWIDDSYNGNPDGAAAAIEFLTSLSGRRWYVTPGLVEMGSRKEEIHREMGVRLAEAGIEKVVLIRDSVTPYIEEGLKEAGYKGEVLWYDFGPTAFNALPKLLVEGDVVLIQNDWPDQYA